MYMYNFDDCFYLVTVYFVKAMWFTKPIQLVHILKTTTTKISVSRHPVWIFHSSWIKYLSLLDTWSISVQSEIPQNVVWSLSGNSLTPRTISIIPKINATSKSPVLSLSVNKLDPLTFGLTLDDLARCVDKVNRKVFGIIDESVIHL